MPRPSCEAVRTAGGNPILVCGPWGRRTPGEHLHGAVPQGTRRTAGRGSGKRRHRYRRMAGPPMRDGADALRTARPEVGIAKPDGKAACRNGFVTALDVTHGNIAETAACGRARRRIGNGTSDVPGTDGYDPGHDIRARARRPGPPAFAAHTARDPGEAARQCARPPPRGLPLTGRPRRRPDTSKPPPQTPTELLIGNTNPVIGNRRDPMWPLVVRSEAD